MKEIKENIPETILCCLLVAPIIALFIYDILNPSYSDKYYIAIDKLSIEDNNERYCVRFENKNRTGSIGCSSSQKVVLVQISDTNPCSYAESGDSRGLTTVYYVYYRPQDIK